MSYPGANRPQGHNHQLPPQQQYQQPQQYYQQPPGPPPSNYYQSGQQPQYAPPPGFQQPQTYGAPPGAPPMHYGIPNQGYQANLPQEYQQFPVNLQPPSQQGFQYSDGSGKRKGLFIGINYVGTSNALAGCHNDAMNMSRFLCERYRFKEDDIVLLMDTPTASQREIPTRANILAAMGWLVNGAAPNDSLFFHYSGHGGSTPDLDGDEDDGFDETILPLDFKTQGEIIDDQLHDILVRSLPTGCRLTAIFDSCHSGSALDLPYIYSTQGKIKEPNMLKDAGQGAMTAVGAYMRGDLGGVFSSLTGVVKKGMNGNKAEQITRSTKTSSADCISFSGCKDDQTSADASEAGKATGAMSFAFISALTKYPQQSYMQLLNTIRDELRGKYDQKPQLSCSHELDCNLLFII